MVNMVILRFQGMAVRIPCIWAATPLAVAQQVLGRNLLPLRQIFGGACVDEQ